MSKEIEFTDATGGTDYANLINSVGLWYNTVGVVFEAFNAANWAQYKIVATEFGSSGVYEADMPAVIAGIYNIVARRQATGSALISDPIVGQGSLEWNGTIVVTQVDVPFIADGFLNRNIAGGSNGGRNVHQALAASRNRVSFDLPSAGLFTVYAEDDTTPLWTGAYTRAAVNALVDINPT